MAASIPTKVGTRLMTCFFIDRRTPESPEKILQSIILIRPGAGPEFGHTDGRIEDRGIGVA
jgi:hypothetical protein